MADEPRRSSWAQGRVHSLLAGAGLVVADDIGLPTLAGELSVPTGHLRTSRVAVAPGG